LAIKRDKKKKKEYIRRKIFLKKKKVCIHNDIIERILNKAKKKTLVYVEMSHLFLLLLLLDFET